MPAMPVVPRSWRVRAEWVSGGAKLTASNVFHFRSVDVFRPAAQLAGVLNAQNGSELFRGTLETATCTGYRCFNLDHNSVTEVHPSTWDPTVNAGSNVAPMVAAVIWGRTSDRTRKPSHFRLPLNKAGVQNVGKLRPDYRPLLEAAWETFRTNLLAAGWEWGSVNYDTGVFLPFLQVGVRREVAVMKSRMAQVFDGP